MNLISIRFYKHYDCRLCGGLIKEGITNSWSFFFLTWTVRIDLDLRLCIASPIRTVSYTQKVQHTPMHPLPSRPHQHMQRFRSNFIPSVATDLVVSIYQQEHADAMFCAMNTMIRYVTRYVAMLFETLPVQVSGNTANSINKSFRGICNVASNIESVITSLGGVYMIQGTEMPARPARLSKPAHFPRLEKSFVNMKASQPAPHLRMNGFYFYFIFYLELIIATTSQQTKRMNGWLVSP